MVKRRKKRWYNEYEGKLPTGHMGRSTEKKALKLMGAKKIKVVAKVPFRY